MKIYQIIATSAMAVLVLAGCNKETETPATPDPDAGTKTITVTINGANLTKVATDGENPYEETHNFSSIDLYFTTASDVVVLHRQITETDNATEWANITDAAKGVRYVGLTGVEKVYVVANGGNIGVPARGENMSEIILDMQNYAATVDQNTIPFVGGDADITPLQDELAPDFNGTSVDPETGEETEPEVGQQYYTANVSIRPVISRLEMDKISVQTKGDTESIDGADIDAAYENRTFRVHWENFKPVLGGIYMSNFYGKWAPLPAKTAATELFATPTGQNGIAEGKWVSLAAGLNVEGLAYYSNYTGDEYGQLFTYAQQAEGDNTVYFDGAGAKCVPFNFLVNYDVTAAEDDIASAPLINKAAGNHPTFHFQFQYDGTNADGSVYSCKAQELKEGSWVDLDKNADELLYQAIVSDFALAVTPGNLYYANVVEFKERNAVVDIKPAKIYKMDAVVITPANLTTGTIAPQEEYNVIVNVKVVDFDTIAVTPVFE